MNWINEWFGAMNAPVVIWLTYGLVVSIPCALAARIAESLARESPRWRARARFGWSAALVVSVALSITAAIGAGSGVATRIGRTTSSRTLIATSTDEVQPATIDQLRFRDSVTGRAYTEPFTVEVPNVVDRLRSSIAATDLRVLVLLCPLSVLLWIAFEATRLQLLRRRWCDRIVEGEAVSLSEDFGPALVGVLRPRIVLPAEVLALPSSDRALVLLHEIEHRRAQDSRLAFAGALLLAAISWNPVAWWIYRRLRLAIEFDCDQRVLTHAVAPLDYGSVLLDVASRGSQPPFATALLERHSWLARRIDRLARRSAGRSARRATTLGSAAGVSLALSAFVPVPLVAPFDPNARMLEQPAQVLGSVQPTNHEYGSWFSNRYARAVGGRRAHTGWRVYQTVPDLVTTFADPSRPVAERADIVLSMQSLSAAPQPGGIAQVLDARPLQQGQYVIRGEMRTDRLGSAALARIMLYDRCSRMQLVHVTHSPIGTSGWTPFQMVFFVPKGTDYYSVDFGLQSNGTLRIRRLEFETLQSPVPILPLPGAQTPGVSCRTSDVLLGGHPESMIPQDLRFTDLTLSLPQLAPRR